MQLVKLKFLEPMVRDTGNIGRKAPNSEVSGWFGLCALMHIK